MSVDFRASVAMGFLLCLAIAGPAAAQPAPQPHSLPADARAAAIGSLPLAFEQNRGQADGEVRYLARGPGYRVFLTGREAALVLDGKSGAAPVLRMALEDANADPVLKGEQLLAHKTNYLVSADAANNIVGVPSHGRVRYESVYPGIDLVYYGTQGKLEYDFVVAPGADASRIGVVFSGAKPAITAAGELSVSADDVQLAYHLPVAYQEIEGRRVTVEARYVVAESGSVHFALGNYDRTLPLVIDPILSYSSYAWDTSSASITVDASRNIYVTGGTSASSPPASGTYQTRVLGATDVYVAKLDPTGKQLLWATYIGGRKATSRGVEVRVDPSGNVYVAGLTDAASFPVTAGAYQTTFAVGQGSFVAKLNPTGTALLYSTFVNGGSVGGMALDANGNVFLTGSGASIVTTSGAFQTTTSAGGNPVPFVAKLNAAGSAMLYVTYVGGSSGRDTVYGIAIDPAGNAYITGETRSANFPLANAMFPSLRGSSDAFVTKLNATGSALVYSTYLGGTSYDSGRGIAVDSLGQAYVAGQAYSDDFPITAGSYQTRKGYTSPNFSNGFITKFSASGTALVYSSFLGGRWCGVGNCDSGGLFLGDGDGLSSIAIDAAGYAYVGGWLISGSFTQLDPFMDVAPYSGDYARLPFFAKLKPGGDAIVHAGVLGNQRNSGDSVGTIAPDNAGGAVFVAYAEVPFTAGAQYTTYTSIAIMKIDAARYPTSVSSNVNPAGAGQTVTLTADVQNPQAGTVSFYDGAAVLGTAPVAAGRATFSASLLPGIHKISAVFSGDGQASLPLFQLVKGQ
jgi:hypothetical protein